MLVYAVLETSFSNSTYKEAIELPDDLTDEEVDAEVREWAYNLINIGYTLTLSEKEIENWV